VRRVPRPFKTTHFVREGVHTLGLSGELDLAASPGFEAVMFQLFADGPAVLILDLRGLTFVDSTGLGMVLLTRVEADKHGCELRIIPGRTNVQRIFELTGLVDVLPWDSPPRVPLPPGTIRVPAGDT
jgi:anti-sigma B factor antagonist